MKDQRLMKKINLFLLVVTYVPMLLACNPERHKELNNVVVEYGWGSYPTLEISVGNCPPFDITCDGTNSIAHPPSRIAIIPGTQKVIRQDFYEPLITSLDGISENLPKKERTKITAFDLSRTSINEISKNAARELNLFTNLKVIVLNSDITDDQKKRNKAICPNIIITTTENNSERERLVTMAASFGKGDQALPKSLPPFG